MAIRGFDLLNLQLDETGRALLPDDLLERIEASASIVFAGGDNVSCGDTGNGSCSNVSCSGSTNGSGCSNESCDGATNYKYCIRTIMT